jgi:hypothetical protein
MNTESNQALKPAAMKLVPDSNLAIKNWTPWKSRRRSGDFITIVEFAAISLGISTAAIAKLNAKTSPSLKTFKNRLKRIFDVVDIGDVKLRSMHARPLKRSDADDIKIVFSNFIEYAHKNKLRLPQPLIDLDAAAILETDRFQVSPNLHAIDDRTSTPESIHTPIAELETLKSKNRSITYAALLVFIGQYMVAKQPFPEKYLRGGKLNQAQLATALETIIKKHFSAGGGDKSGHGIDSIRKTIGATLKEFPNVAYAKVFSQITDEEKSNFTNLPEDSN